MKEIGYGYFATEKGEIYSSKSGRFISQRINHHGYLVVNLSINGKCKTFTVHRLIAKAFSPRNGNFKVVNHLDGNKLNNNISNLEWTTHKGNSQHALKLNLIKHARGKQTKNGKFSDSDIYMIRDYLKQGFSHSKISRMYGVTKSAIQQISNGKTYKHVV